MNLGWDTIKQLLKKAWTWTGIQTFSSIVATTADINGGTIDGVTNVNGIKYLSGYSSFLTAITTISTSTTTLIVDCSGSVDADTIIPSTLSLIVVKGGLLTIASGKTLTINGHLEAGPYQLFSGAGTIVLTSVEVHYPEWYSSGTFTQATIEAALTVIGTTNKVTLLLRPGTWVISSNADWSAYTNVTLKMSAGAILQIATGTTTTIGGPFEARLYQVFDCVGTGAVTGLKEATPQMFGGVADGVTDDKVAIKAAIASVIAGGRVIIPKRALAYSYNNDSGMADAVDVAQSTIIQIDGTIKSTSATNQVSPPYIFNITGENVTFTGSGTLQGPGTYVVSEITTANQPGLIYVNADGVTIKGLAFIDPPEVAVYINNKDNIRIEENTFTGGPLWAAVAAAPNGYHSYITSIGGNNQQILKNRFFADGSGGAAVTGILFGSSTYGTKITISKNKFKNLHSHATYLTQISHSIISENIIEYTQIAAEQRSNALKAGGQYLTITGNNIKGAALGGIISYAASSNIISNNIINDFGAFGIEATNNTAQVVGLNYNTISNNILSARTDGTAVYSGIYYVGSAATSADCVGGKISGNTLINTGEASSGAIYVAHINASYFMVDFDILDNKIISPAKYSIVTDRVTKSNISGNTAYNPQTAASAMIQVTDSTSLRVESNTIRDDQSPAVTTAFIKVNSTGNNYIDLINNSCFTTGNTASLGNTVTYHTQGRGNRLSETDALTGVFTLNNVNTLVIANTNISYANWYNGVTTILLQPVNAAAAAIQGSAKHIYVSAVVANTSFTVSTGDGNAV
ncbi:MAG: right-handed parallel beta-helix repeat-containing protein, partial [Clostridia bacterium]